MNRASFAAERLYAVLTRRGARITIRTPTSLSGPTPSPNPPRITGLVLSGAHTQGDTTLALSGSTIVGRFIAGDVLLLNGHRYTVQSDVTATANAVIIPVLPALIANMSGGEAVTVEWKADQVLPAAVAAYARRLVDGSLIEASDMAVTISAHRLSQVPNLNSKVILPGDDLRAIVSITPQVIEGIPASYVLQVR